MESKKTKSKSVDYKKLMTLNKLKKEISSFIKYSEDVTIQVAVWDYTNYKETSVENIEDQYLFLYLEVYVTLNDYDSICDNNKAWCIIEIPQYNIPQDQFESTENKLIKESNKIAKSLQEAFGDRCRYEYDDDDDVETKIQYRTEIKYYDHSLTC